MRHKLLKKLLVVHPFLFAIFPVLFLFAYNIDEVFVTDLLLPMLVVIALTLILFLSLRLITKNYNKIAIITSYFLVWFFSYGHVRELVKGVIFSLEIRGFIADHHSLLLLLLWALLFITGAFLMIKARSDFSTSTKFLNVVAITLVTISLINIGIYATKTTNLMPEEINEEGNSLNSDNLPDIYYIILDSYDRADTLKEAYNYDNSQFIDYLTNKGFYVATQSRSNYGVTPLSMASSLNMEYINYLSDTLGTETKDLSIPYKMISNNKVSQFLKSKGYRYVFIHSGWVPKDIDRYADVYKNMSRFGFSNFSAYLTQTTALIPFVDRFISENRRLNILLAFDALSNIPNYKEPVFVFAHVVCPHGPYLFDRDGNPPEGEGTYIDQVIFVNKKVKVVVDDKLSKSRVPPVIILQADTGHVGETHFNIFNAYYFPEKGYDLLYESVTPVNSFRIVFNLYFDTDYDLLKDESYFADYERPYEFIPVPRESGTD